MVKIYLNDQHLILDKNFDQSAGTDAPDFSALIREIEQGRNSRTLHSADPRQDLEAIKKLYRVVQAGGGLVSTPDGDILLIHRKGKWDLPKGKLEEGEDLETCALREVEEETGLRDIHLDKKIGVTYHTYTERGVAIMKESHWFFMNVSQQQDLTPQTEEDIEECRWVPAEAIETYYEGAHASIRDVLQMGLPHIKKRKAASGL